MKNEKHAPFDRNFDNLEELADAIGEAFQCPVTIEDANHRLLAYSSHDSETDPARTATIIGRRVPERVISSLWQSGAMQKLMESSEPIRISSIHPVGLGDRVAVSIRQNEETIGYIWLLDREHRLNEEDFRHLKAAAQAAKVKLLQFRMKKFREDEELEHFFWQLLTGHYKLNAQIQSRAQALATDLPLPYQIVIIQFAEELDRTAKQQLHYLIKTTHSIRSVFHVFSRNEMIVLACPVRKDSFYSDCTDFVKMFRRQVKERFNLHPHCEAIGSLQHEYSAVQQSYEEALAVLKVKRSFARELNDKFHYDDLGFYRFLPYIAEQKQLQGYENHSLIKIKAYDAEHGSNLLETLQVFLFLNCDIKKTAEALHVHANTLLYRVKRMAQIGDIDFENADQKVTLYIELKTELMDRSQ